MFGHGSVAVVFGNWMPWTMDAVLDEALCEGDDADGFGVPMSRPLLHLYSGFMVKLLGDTSY
jgi:hypothetical protein